MQIPSLKGLCKKHQNRKEIAICFNKSHNESSICCSKCIFDDHKDCPAEKIFLYKELNSNVILNGKQQEHFHYKEGLLHFVREIKQESDKYFDRLLEEEKVRYQQQINKIQSSKEDARINYNRLIEEIEVTLKTLAYQDLSNSYRLEKVKNMSEIQVFDFNKIIITPKPVCKNEETVMSYLDCFKNSLTKYNELRTLSFTIPDKLWSGHSDLDIITVGRKVLIKRANLNKGNNNFKVFDSPDSFLNT